jgi:chemotaxis signal transduction protein
MFSSDAVTTGNDTERLDFFVFRAGRYLFALPESAVERIAERLTPARLPFAPPAVAGVVSAQGRIFTIIDPRALFEDQSLETPTPIPLLIIIRNDEQLALYADSLEQNSSFLPAEISPADSKQNPAIAGVVNRGDQKIFLLDPRHLFSGATDKLERRRRRS